MVCFVDALDDATLRQVVKNLLDPQSDQRTAHIVASRLALALAIQVPWVPRRHPC
jgi:hypothetical protein